MRLTCKFIRSRVWLYRGRDTHNWQIWWQTGEKSRARSTGTKDRAIAQARADEFRKKLPGEWRWHLDGVPLGENEFRILFAVMARRRVRTSELIEQLWPDPDLEPQWPNGVVTSTVHKLNARLAPSGWRVRASIGRGGYGYQLERVEEARLAA